MAATWRHWRHWRDTGGATARGTCCRVQNRPTSPSALQAECAAWAWHLPLVGRRQPPPLGVKVGSGGSPLSSSLHSFARAQLRRGSTELLQTRAPECLSALHRDRPSSCGLPALPWPLASGAATTSWESSGRRTLWGSGPSQR